MCFSFVFITAFRGCLPVGRLLLLYYIILDREGFVIKKVTPIEDFLWSISILTDPGVDDSKLIELFSGFVADLSHEMLSVLALSVNDLSEISSILL